ncbi:MAG: oligosaccharide flippase family protein [Myxococcales bacterium]|nr:oligosaccharide flippase family protein [Myxococcales bacterium]
MRRSIAHFGLGKLLNGVLGLVILLVVARGLAPAEYGAYLILVAVVQLSINVAGLGIGAVANVYLPRYRLIATPVVLVRFVLMLLLTRGLALVATSAVLFALREHLARLFGIEAIAGDLLGPYLLVVVFWGLASHVQRSIFEPLLQQGAAQLNWGMRNLIFAGLLLAAAADGGLDFSAVIWSEIIAAIGSAVVGAAQCLWYWRKLAPPDNDGGLASLPDRRDLVRIAAFDHLSFLQQTAGDTQAVLLAAGWMLGPETMAGFGFGVTVAEQIRTYLPARLLWPTVAPAMVANYARRRDFTELNETASLLYKSSLFVLAPIFAVFLAAGEMTLDVLSGDRYGDAALFTMGWLATLLPLSHRVVLSGTAMILERAEAVAKAGLTSVATIPIGVLLLKLGFGAHGLVAAVLATAILYNGVLWWDLRRFQFHFRYDAAGTLKLVAATLATCLCLLPFSRNEPSLTGLCALAVASVVVYLAICFVIKPFSRGERAWINALLPKPLFIW